MLHFSDILKNFLDFSINFEYNDKKKIIGRRVFLKTFFKSALSGLCVLCVAFGVHSGMNVQAKEESVEMSIQSVESVEEDTFYGYYEKHRKAMNSPFYKLHNSYMTFVDENKDIIQDYLVEKEESKDYTFVLSFAGDMMLASYKNQTTPNSFNQYSNEKDPSYFLEKVKPFFEEDDYTIVNLENVLTDNNLKEVAKDHNPAYWYRSKTSNTNILTSSSVECVSLANNHTGDYGNQGRKDTIAAVENAGLIYGNNDKTFYLEKNGYTIAVICHGLWSEWQANDIVSRLKDAEQYSDFQIVFYHGGTERIPHPEEWKIRASRKLVDNGADLVVGNHPHVLQPIENYNGVDIIYSMGNFCYGGSSRCENRTIIYQLKLTISNDNVLLNKEAVVIPCYVYTAERNNYQPGPIEDEIEKQKVLDFINWVVNSPV